MLHSDARNHNREAYKYLPDDPTRLRVSPLTASHPFKLASHTQPPTGRIRILYINNHKRLIQKSKNIASTTTTMGHGTFKAHASNGSLEAGFLHDVSDSCRYESQPSPQLDSCQN